MCIIFPILHFFKMCKTECQILDTCFEDGPICPISAEVRSEVCDHFKLTEKECPSDVLVVTFGPTTFFCANNNNECVKAFPVCQKVLEVANAAASQAEKDTGKDEEVVESAPLQEPLQEEPMDKKVVPDARGQMESVKLATTITPSAEIVAVDSITQTPKTASEANAKSTSTGETNGGDDDIRYEEGGVFLSHLGWNHIISPLLDVIERQEDQIQALNETIHQQQTVMVLMRDTTVSVNRTMGDFFSRIEKRMEEKSVDSEEKKKKNDDAEKKDLSSKGEPSVSSQIVNSTVTAALDPVLSKVGQLNETIDTVKMDHQNHADVAQQEMNELADKVNALAEDNKSALRKSDRAIYLANNSLNFSNNNKQDIKQLNKSAIADREVAQRALDEATDLRKAMDESDVRTGDAFEAANEARNIANDAAHDADAAKLKAQEAKNMAEHAETRVHAVEEAFKDTVSTRELEDLRRRHNEDHAKMEKMNITVVKSASDIETIPDKVKM